MAQSPVAGAAIGLGAPPAPHLLQGLSKRSEGRMHASLLPALGDCRDAGCRCCCQRHPHEGVWGEPRWGQLRPLPLSAWSPLLSAVLTLGHPSSVPPHSAGLCCPLAASPSDRAAPWVQGAGVPFPQPTLCFAQCFWESGACGLRSRLTPAARCPLRARGTAQLAQWQQPLMGGLLGGGGLTALHCSAPPRPPTGDVPCCDAQGYCRMSCPADACCWPPQCPARVRGVTCAARGATSALHLPRSCPVLCLRGLGASWPRSRDGFETLGLFLLTSLGSSCAGLLLPSGTGATRPLPCAGAESFSTRETGRGV